MYSQAWESNRKSKNTYPSGSQQLQNCDRDPRDLEFGTVPKFSSADMVRVPSQRRMENIRPRCADCGRVPPAKSFVCADGHLTCVECVCKPDVPKTTCGQCSKPLNRMTNFAYETLLNGTKRVCPAEPCPEVYQDVSEHQLTCIGSENLTCPESECPHDDLWTAKSLVAHLIQDHNVVSYDNYRLFKVEPWWFGNETGRVTFVLKYFKNTWIGVAFKDKVDGKDACAFTLYHVLNERKVSSQKEKLEFTAALSFRTNPTVPGSETWNGAPPSIYEKRDKVLAEKQCLIAHIPPQDIRCLEVNITPFVKSNDPAPGMDPIRAPSRQWKPKKGSETIP